MTQALSKGINPTTYRITNPTPNTPQDLNTITALSVLTTTGEDPGIITRTNNTDTTTGKHLPRPATSKEHVLALYNN